MPGLVEVFSGFQHDMTMAANLTKISGLDEEAFRLKVAKLTTSVVYFIRYLGTDSERGLPADLYPLVAYMQGQAGYGLHNLVQAPLHSSEELAKNRSFMELDISFLYGFFIAYRRLLDDYPELRILFSVTTSEVDRFFNWFYE